MMNKKFRCLVEHIRTGDRKDYVFKVGKIYKVETSLVSKFHTIYHGKKQFQVSTLFLKNKFIDEDIVQTALNRDKQIDEILKDE